jgi:hypothetical protein
MPKTSNKLESSINPSDEIVGTMTICPMTVIAASVLLLAGLGSAVLDDTVALKATLPEAGAV